MRAKIFFSNWFEFWGRWAQHRCQSTPVFVHVLVKHDVTYSVLRPQMHHSVTTSIIQPMFTFLKSIFDVDHESVTTQNYLDVVLELYTCISGFLLYMTLKWEYLHRFSIFSISVFVISRRSWNILRSVP